LLGVLRLRPAALNVRPKQFLPASGRVPAESLAGSHNSGGRAQVFVTGSLRPPTAVARLIWGEPRDPGGPPPPGRFVSFSLDRAAGRLFPALAPPPGPAPPPTRPPSPRVRPEQPTGLRRVTPPAADTVPCPCSRPPPPTARPPGTPSWRPPSQPI